MAEPVEPLPERKPKRPDPKADWTEIDYLRSIRFILLFWTIVVIVGGVIIVGIMSEQGY